MNNFVLDCMHCKDFVQKYGQSAYEALPDEAFLVYENVARLFDVVHEVWEMMPNCCPISEPSSIEPFGDREFITHLYLVEHKIELRPVSDLN